MNESRSTAFYAFAGSPDASRKAFCLAPLSQRLIVKHPPLSPYAWAYCSHIAHVARCPPLSLAFARAPHRLRRLYHPRRTFVPVLNNWKREARDEEDGRAPRQKHCPTAGFLSLIRWEGNEIEMGYICQEDLVLFESKHLLAVPSGVDARLARLASLNRVTSIRSEHCSLLHLRIHASTLPRDWFIYQITASNGRGIEVLHAHQKSSTSTCVNVILFMHYFSLYVSLDSRSVLIPS